MTLVATNPNIAILVANGFDEHHITPVQRAMTKEKLSCKIIAPEQGLVNGWQGNAWGHYFAVDESISTAMGSDYDLLILIGGERGVAKLKTNLHTRRIVNHFLEAQKPIATIGAGAALLTLSTKSAGLSVSAPADCAPDIAAAQMVMATEAMTSDGAVLSSNGTEIDTWVEAVLALARGCAAQNEAEAA